MPTPSSSLPAHIHRPTYMQLSSRLHCWSPRSSSLLWRHFSLDSYNIYRTEAASVANTLHIYCQFPFLRPELGWSFKLLLNQHWECTELNYMKTTGMSPGSLTGALLVDPILRISDPGSPSEMKTRHNHIIGTLGHLMLMFTCTLLISLSQCEKVECLLCKFPRQGAMNSSKKRKP